METSETTLREPKTLPVIMCLDCSYSMSVMGKIQAMNQSVSDLLEACSDEDTIKAPVRIAVVTFGGTAQLHAALQPAGQVQWQDMAPSGNTPMGSALRIAKGIIEDREQVASRSLRPVVLLVSDGLPTDEWQVPLQELANDGRSKKADRIALAIGPDADEQMMRTFASDPAETVYHAEDAAGIRDFFRELTMSITKHGTSCAGTASLPTLPKEIDGIAPTQF